MQIVDLFAGCGGLSLGFQNAGFTIAAAFDHWKAAVEVYSKNFRHPIYQLDLNALNNLSLIRQFSPEMIIGGPPCQDYSSAGKRDENLGRADLTIRFAEIVADIKPRWFVMENVERIVDSRNLREARRIFKQAGYALSQDILNASFCGVPQNRKRFFLVGEIDGQENALLPYFQKNMTRNPMTIHDYLGSSLGIEYYYRHPRSYARRAIFSIYEPSPTVRGVNRPVPSTYKNHPGDAAPVSLDLRPLTTLERSYIQTFPTDFKFSGSKTDLEQMIGNAVPVKLAEFVACAIQDYCDDRANGVQIEAIGTELIQLPLI